MNKLQILENLKKSILENGKVETFYASRNGDGCSYCAVGYILKEAGFNDETLLEISEGYVPAIGGMFRYVKQRDLVVFTSSSERFFESKGEIVTEIVKSLESLGFTSYELSELQDINDASPFGQELINFVDRLIEREESNLSMEV